MDNQFPTTDVNPVGRGLAATMAGQVGDSVELAREAAADFGRKTVESIDARRHPVAGTLDYTASTLHQQADMVAGTAHATADTLQATADYLRQKDATAMAKDVRGLVGRYPGQALAAAVVLGVLVGRAVWPRA